LTAILDAEGDGPYAKRRGREAAFLLPEFPTSVDLKRLGEENGGEL